MKNTYNTPELMPVGAINEVVLGSKITGVLEGDLTSFTALGVLDID